MITRREFAALAAAAAVPGEVSWPIEHHHDHVQGLEASRDWFWISAVDRRTKTGWVWRVDRKTLKTAAERDITQGPLYHPGGLQAAGGGLWVPIAEYRPKSRARVLRLDPMTLAGQSSFEVEDHIGALATDGRTFVLGANWDARRLYRWSLSGELVNAADNPGPLAIQDMKWVDGALWAGGLAKNRCRLVRLDPETYREAGEAALPEDRCYTHEGMARFDGRFYFLPEDEPRTRVYEMIPGRAGIVRRQAAGRSRR